MTCYDVNDEKTTYTGDNQRTYIKAISGYFPQ